MEVSKKTEILEAYEKINDESSLKRLIELILDGKLSKYEYVKLYESGDELLKTTIILKAPADVVKDILMQDNEFYLAKVLERRMQKDNDLDELINAVYVVRKHTLKYVSKSKLIERLLVEEEKSIIKYIFKILNDYTFTEEEFCKLLKAKSPHVRVHFIQYVWSKEKLVKYLLVEQDKEVLAKTLYYLGDYKISSTTANKLMDSYYFMVRQYAAKYATKSKLIEILKEELTIDVISEILKRLENYKISEREAKSLMVNSNTVVKQFAIKHLSKEELAKMLENNVKINSSIIVYEILENLKDYRLPQNLADKLLYSKHDEIRRFAVKYASENQLVSKLSVEKDETVCEMILKRLKNYKFTQKQANHLLYSDSINLVIYVLKLVSRDKLITYLLNPKVKIDDKFIKVLDEIKFTKGESETLINSKAFKVRKYFVKYASKEKLLEKLINEPVDEVVISIIENL